MIALSPKPRNLKPGTTVAGASRLACRCAVNGKGRNFLARRLEFHALPLHTATIGDTVTLDAGSSANEGNRRPSRLLAAYAKAAERARQEALATAADPAAGAARAIGGQHGPPSSAETPAMAAKSRASSVVPPSSVQARTVSAQARTRASGRSSTYRRGMPRRIRWILAAAACVLVVATWRGGASRGSDLAADVNYDMTPAAVARQRSVAAVTEARPSTSQPVGPIALASMPPTATRATGLELALPAVRTKKAIALPGSIGSAIDSAAPSAADQWVSPQLTKFGVRHSWRAAAIGVSDPELVHHLQQGLAELWMNRAATNRDVIFLGIRDDADLARIEAVRPALKSGGVLWVLYGPHNPSTASAVIERAHAAAFSLGRRFAFSPIYDAISFVNSSR
jgi:hypothetical protein